MDGKCLNPDCGHARRFIGIGTNGLITFRMFICGFCGRRSIERVEICPQDANFRHQLIDGCFAKAERQVSSPSV
jgi:hypothetical protein